MRYPYYRYSTGLSHDGRKLQLQFLSKTEKNIVEDFYMNNEGRIEGEFVYYNDIEEKFTILPS